MASCSSPPSFIMLSLSAPPSFPARELLSISAASHSFSCLSNMLCALPRRLPTTFLPAFSVTLLHPKTHYDQDYSLHVRLLKMTKADVRTNTFCHRPSNSCLILISVTGCSICQMICFPFDRQNWFLKESCLDNVALREGYTCSM